MIFLICQGVGEGSGSSLWPWGAWGDGRMNDRGRMEGGWRMSGGRMERWMMEEEQRVDAWQRIGWVVRGRMNG